MADIRKIKLGNSDFNVRDSRLDGERTVVVIGDSYGTGKTQSVNVYTPYPDILATYRGLTIISGCESGAGFKNEGDEGHTFMDLLTASYDPSYSSDVADVYALGGINDRLYGEIELNTAIELFCNKAHELYKNAIVHVGFIGWSINPGAYSYIDLKNTFIRYRNCLRYNAVYVTGIENVMHNMAYFDVDKLHPNQYGQYAIAGALFNDVLGVPIGVIYGRSTIDLFTRDGATFSRLLVESLENDHVGYGWDTPMTIGNLSIYGSRQWDGSTTLSLANTGTDRGFALGENGMRQTIPCTIHTTGGDYIHATVEFALYRGLFQITPTIIANNTFPTVAIDYIVISPVWYNAIASEN